MANEAHSGLKPQSLCAFPQDNPWSWPATLGKFCPKAGFIGPPYMPIRTLGPYLKFKVLHFFLTREIEHGTPTTYYTVVRALKLLMYN